MLQQRSIAASMSRWVRATVVLALGAGIAPAAFGYNAQITYGAGSVIYFLDPTAPADSKEFPLQTISTNLSIPLTISRDTSISAGPAGGHFAATSGAYNALVEPGALHLSARSAATIDYAAVAGADRKLVAQDGGSVETRLADDVTFNVAGLAPGTPFLLDVNVRVDGNFGSFGGPAGTPITPNAYAEGEGRWGFGLLVYSGRPAGVPSSMTNQFAQGGMWAARFDGTSFNEFSQYGYPSAVTVTMYATSGVVSTIEMFARLTTGAFADATYSPNATGLVEAGVNGNLSDTVAWGGITAVRRLDGTALALSDLSTVSSSGFDYREAFVSSVPEPSAGSLMAIGVLCCVGFARACAQRSGAVPASA